MVQKLSYTQARKKCPREFIPCSSTDQMAPLQQIIGQERAVRALQFGLDIKELGFNIFVAGMPGTGRKTAIVGFLEERAKEMPVPPDWCYVNNFEDPNSPNALKLPTGEGGSFRDDMARFVEEMKGALKAAFESDDYAQQRDKTLKSYEAKKNELLRELNQKASEAGFALQRSQIGMLLIPVINGQRINEQQFGNLPQSVQREIQERRKRLRDQMRSAFMQFRDIDRDAQKAIQGFNEEVASYAIDDLFASLKEKYGGIEAVVHYLDEVKKDILSNLSTILTPQDRSEGPLA